MSLAALDFLPFHRALIEEEEISAVVEVLQSGWITTGPRTLEFEHNFAGYIGSKHALAVNSCTAALHLALAAVGIAENDEVIVPTMTFAATGEVVLYFKARPILVDCECDSFQVDPQEIERAITPRTRAILPVHFSGSACEMDSILEIARRYDLRVIEDAAHALPARYKGRMIGTLGDITCFSFYATKTLTTGEGGMAVTDNPDYADAMRMLSLHGISKDAWKRYTSEGSWRYQILEPGYKYNLTDIQAALGLAQLAKCEAMRRRRACVADIYNRLLSCSDAFEIPASPEYCEHAWHLYVLRVRPEVLRIDRDRVIEELKMRGIGSSVHFIPLHLHPLYQTRLQYRPGQFPNAEKHFERAISLPIYPSMTFEEAHRVVDALQDITLEFRR